MEPKDLWVLFKWEPLNVGPSSCKIAFRRSVISVQLRKFVVVILDFRAEASFEHSSDESHILVVSHTTTIVSSSYHVVQGLVRNHILLI
jgi:hypothetical protein